MGWRHEGARSGRTGAAEFARGVATKFTDDAGNCSGRSVSCGHAFAWRGFAGAGHEAAFEFGIVDTVIVMSKSGLRGFGRPSEPPRRAGAGSDQSNEQDHAPRVSPPLDDAAREALQKLPNVVEVYPQIRFPTEVRFAGKPYATMVAGIPDSARGNGAFD